MAEDGEKTRFGNLKFGPGVAIGELPAGCAFWINDFWTDPQEIAEERRTQRGNPMNRPRGSAEERFPAPRRANIFDPSSTSAIEELANGCRAQTIQSGGSAEMD